MGNKEQLLTQYKEKLISFFDKKRQSLIKELENNPFKTDIELPNSDEYDGDVMPVYANSTKASLVPIDAAVIGTSYAGHVVISTIREDIFQDTEYFMMVFYIVNVLEKQERIDENSIVFDAAHRPITYAKKFTEN